MLSFSAVRRIFVARGHQNMRRGIDTLVSMVENQLGHAPYTGDGLVFLSRDRRKLKVLIWEDGGFWLCMKRLERCTFADVASWSDSTDQTVAVSPARIDAWIEGINEKTVRIRARVRAEGLGPSRRFVKCGRGIDDPRQPGQEAGRQSGAGGDGQSPGPDAGDAGSPGPGQASDRQVADRPVWDESRDECSGAHRRGSAGDGWQLAAPAGDHSRPRCTNA